MKKALLTVAAVAALGAYASSASAQCDFNEPGKAKGLKSSMVKAYAACPGITFGAPNAFTMAGVPGCAPTFAISAYKFDTAKGKCDLKTSQKTESPCSSYTAEPEACVADVCASGECDLGGDTCTTNTDCGPELRCETFANVCTTNADCGLPFDCANLSLSLKCSGVVKADGVTPSNEAGWSLNTVARATFSDREAGDMTVIDFPAQFPLPQADGGKFSGKFTTNELLTDLFGPGSELPACTAVQIIRVAVADPAGNTFATLGTSSR